MDESTNRLKTWIHLCWPDDDIYDDVCNRLQQLGFTPTEWIEDGGYCIGDIHKFIVTW